MTSPIDRRTRAVVRLAARRSPRRRNLSLGIAAAVVYALMAPGVATAQEALMSTTVAPLASGATTSRLNLDTVKPQSATIGGLALPSLSLTDDGSGPRVRSLMLQMPAFDVAGVSVASGLGDQRLPAVVRDSALAGPALGSSGRGLTLAFKSSTPLTLSFAQMPAGPGKPLNSNSPALAAAAMSFTPGSRLSVTPKLLFPAGAPDAQRSVGTAIRANVVSNVAFTTDVGMAGTADTSWTPLGSARLVGQWPRGGIETVVFRGAAAPRTGANTAFLSSRDREAAQAQVQPLKGLTVAALTSVSRPSADPVANDTTLGSLRLVYDRFSSGQVAAVQQREATGSRETDLTSVEWRQRAAARMTVRFVRQSATDSAPAGIDRTSSRVELDFPVLAPHAPGGLDLRAALTAGSISQTDSGVSSKFSGRVALVDNAVLTGETELGLTGRDGQLLHGLRVTTEMPVVPATNLQLSYTYRTGPQFPVGQVFEARIVRRVRLGW
jgi:hypothetical protein